MLIAGTSLRTRNGGCSLQPFSAGAPWGQPSRQPMQSV